MKAMLELGIHTINEVQFNAYKNIEISIWYNSLSALCNKMYLHSHDK